MQDFEGAEVLFGSVSEEASLASAFRKPVDVVLSCLASRTGGKVSCMVWSHDVDPCIQLDTEHKATGTCMVRHASTRALQTVHSLVVGRLWSAWPPQSCTSRPRCTAHTGARSQPHCL